MLNDGEDVNAQTEAETEAAPGAKKEKDDASNAALSIGL